MTSVRHTNGDFLRSADEPSVTGDFTYGCWIKIATYGTADATSLAWDGGGNFMRYKVGSVTTTAIAELFDGDDFFSATILTGSDTSWVFVSWRHSSGSTSYTFSHRKEGASSLTTNTLTAGTQLSLPDQISIGTNGDNEHAIDSSSRSFFARSDRLSDGDLLTASTALTAPSGTNQAFLDLDSPTDAGDNQGTGSDYTVTGTLQTDATEPDPSIGGGGGTVTPQGGIAFIGGMGGGFRKPRRDDGKWTRGRGGLWVPRRSYSFPFRKAA